MSSVLLGLNGGLLPIGVRHSIAAFTEARTKLGKEPITNPYWIEASDLALLNERSAAYPIAAKRYHSTWVNAQGLLHATRFHSTTVYDERLPLTCRGRLPSELRTLQELQKASIAYKFVSPYWIPREFAAGLGVQVRPDAVVLACGGEFVVNADQTTDAAAFNEDSCPDIRIYRFPDTIELSDRIAPEELRQMQLAQPTSDLWVDAAAVGSMGLTLVDATTSPLRVSLLKRTARQLTAKTETETNPVEEVNLYRSTDFVELSLLWTYSTFRPTVISSVPVHSIPPLMRWQLWLDKQRSQLGSTTWVDVEEVAADPAPNASGVAGPLWSSRDKLLVNADWFPQMSVTELRSSVKRHSSQRLSSSSKFLDRGRERRVHPSPLASTTRRQDHAAFVFDAGTL